MLHGKRELGQKNWLDWQTRIHTLPSSRCRVGRHEAGSRKPTKLIQPHSGMASTVRGTSTSTLPGAPNRPGQAGLPTFTPNPATVIYQNSTLEYLSLHTHRSDFDANRPTMKPLPMMNNRAIHLGLITVNLLSSCTSHRNFPDRSYSN